MPDTCFMRSSNTHETFRLSLYRPLPGDLRAEISVPTGFIPISDIVPPHAVPRVNKPSNSKKRTRNGQGTRCPAEKGVRPVAACWFRFLHRKHSDSRTRLSNYLDPNEIVCLSALSTTKHALNKAGLLADWCNYPKPARS